MVHISTPDGLVKQFLLKEDLKVNAKMEKLTQMLFCLMFHQANWQIMIVKSLLLAVLNRT